MVKKYIIVTILALAASTTTPMQDSGTLSSDRTLHERRKMLTNTPCVEEIPHIDPSIKIVEKLSRSQRYGVCHDYALSKQLGIVGRLPNTFTAQGNTDWYERFNVLEDYFEKTTTPKAGDLVIYHDTTSWYPKDIEHTGLVYGEDMVESKWDDRPAIFVHPTFSTPHIYGNEVDYYRKTKTDKEIISDLQEKISHDNELKSICARANERLLMIAENPSDSSSPDQLISKWLNWTLCADVNTTDYKGRTPLHLAAKTGDKKVVETLVEYGADIHKQDNYGNTALHVASLNNRHEIAQFLVKNRGLKSPRFALRF